MNDIVSVVIPVGEWENFVVRAIKSVQSQGSIVGEILLIDNAISRPEIRTSVLAKISDPKLRVVKSKIYRDAARARNIGIDCAHYDFIAVLDSDDEYLPGHLNRAIHSLDLAKADFYCSSYLNKDHNGTEKLIAANSSVDIPVLLSDYRIGHSTVVFRKSSKIRYPEIGLRHDLAAWLQYFQTKDASFVSSQKVGMIRHKRADSYSSVSKLKLLFKQLNVSIKFSGVNIFIVLLLQTKYIMRKLVDR